MNTLKIFLIGVIFGYSGLSAQSNFNVVVNDSLGVGIPFPNVLLLNPADSTLVLGTIASEEGNYLLKNVAKGNHRILGTMVGYTSTYSPVFNLSADHTAVPLFILEGEKLEEVNISVDKPK